MAKYDKEKRFEEKYYLPNARSQSSKNYRNYPKMLKENEKNLMKCFFKSCINNNSNALWSFGTAFNNSRYNPYIDPTSDYNSYLDMFNTSYNNKTHNRTHNKRRYKTHYKTHNKYNKLPQRNIRYNTFNIRNNNITSDEDSDATNLSSNAKVGSEAPTEAGASAPPSEGTSDPPPTGEKWRTVYELIPAPNIEDIINKPREKMDPPERAKYKRYCWRKARTAMHYRDVRDLCKTVHRYESGGVTEEEMDYEVAMKDVIKMLKEAGVVPADYKWLRDCVYKKKGIVGDVEMREKRSGSRGQEDESDKSGSQKSETSYFTPKSSFSERKEARSDSQLKKNRLTPKKMHSGS